MIWFSYQCKTIYDCYKQELVKTEKKKSTKQFLVKWWLKYWSKRSVSWILSCPCSKYCLTYQRHKYQCFDTCNRSNRSKSRIPLTTLNRRYWCIWSTKQITEIINLWWGEINYHPESPGKGSSPSTPFTIFSTLRF